MHNFPTLNCTMELLVGSSLEQNHKQFKLDYPHNRKLLSPDFSLCL